MARKTHEPSLHHPCPQYYFEFKKKSSCLNRKMLYHMVTKVASLVKSKKGTGSALFSVVTEDNYRNEARALYVYNL